MFYRNGLSVIISEIYGGDCIIVSAGCVCSVHASTLSDTRNGLINFPAKLRQMREFQTISTDQFLLDPIDIDGSKKGIV